MNRLVAACVAVLVPIALLVGPAGAEGGPPTDSSPVSLSAAPVVGETVGVVPATWGQTPDRRSYEWLRDGEGDVLASGDRYAVTSADAGHTLVVVERVWFGTRQDDSSSTPVAVVSPVAAPSPAAASPQPAPAAAITPAVNTGRPTITGTTKVGRTLKVRSKGTWVAPGHAYRYQWLRNGTVIKKATKTSYRLTSKDRRTKISVRVLAVRPGYPTVTAASRSTGRVR